MWLDSTNAPVPQPLAIRCPNICYHIIAAG